MANQELFSRLSPDEREQYELAIDEIQDGLTSSRSFETVRVQLSFIPTRNVQDMILDLLASCGYRCMVTFEDREIIYEIYWD